MGIFPRPLTCLIFPLSSSGSKGVRGQPKLEATGVTAACSISEGQKLKYEQDGAGRTSEAVVGLDPGSTDGTALAQDDSDVLLEVGGRIKVSGKTFEIKDTLVGRDTLTGLITHVEAILGIVRS